MSRQYNRDHRHRWRMICHELVKLYNAQLRDGTAWFLDSNASLSGEDPFPIAYRTSQRLRFAYPLQAA
ncbi:MAG: hypothetical protein HYY37_00940 [Candidatus Aenigmarchaeota archaeon]|nr:hypothetical protein [Candidatus Aenigmarchaeota archaeon]